MGIIALYLRCTRVGEECGLSQIGSESRFQRTELYLGHGSVWPRMNHTEKIWGMMIWLLKTCSGGIFLYIPWSIIFEPRHVQIHQQLIIAAGEVNIGEIVEKNVIVFDPRSSQKWIRDGNVQIGQVI